MKRPPNDRGQGRKQESGQLMQVQIRVVSDDETAIIAELTPRQRTQSMLVPQHIQRTGQRKIITLTDSLPCATITPDGLCGKDAFGAYAEEVNLTGQWPMQGQWILQPVCRECALKNAEVYK